MATTKIEWADKVWNPITGCTPCSPGCANCYAKRMAQRLRGRCGYPADDPFRVTFHADRLEQPKHWRKPARIFVCSMGDLFHEDLWFYNIKIILDVMRECPQHTFLVLTKRSHFLPGFDEFLRTHKFYWPANLHLGISVSNQKEANEKIPQLLKTSAAVKFISYEPALGPLDLAHSGWIRSYQNNYGEISPHSRYYPGLTTLHWVVAGCESGPGRRPANLLWFRYLRDQCVSAGVPFFLKQMSQGGKVVHMPELDGKVYGELPGEN